MCSCSKRGAFLEDDAWISQVFCRGTLWIPYLIQEISRSLSSISSLQHVLRRNVPPIAATLSSHCLFHSLHWTRSCCRATFCKPIWSCVIRKLLLVRAFVSTSAASGRFRQIWPAEDWGPGSFICRVTRRPMSLWIWFWYLARPSKIIPVHGIGLSCRYCSLEKV